MSCYRLLAKNKTAGKTAKEMTMKKLFVVFLVLMLVPICAFAQQAAAAATAEVRYSVHMSNIGWGGFAVDGETAGTTGQNRQIEAIRASVISNVTGSIRYDVHVQNVGWLGWQFDNDIAGTTGRNLQVEAIRVQLSGQLAARFDVRYRVHMSNQGWSGWSVNGEAAGTTGQNRQLEAIEIRLVAK